MSDAAPLVRFVDVHKAFDGKPVLRGMDLEVHKGEILFIIGTSGVGKSVTIKHLIGLLRIDAGEIWFDGRRIDRLDERGFYPVRRRIGMVFQNATLFDESTKKVLRRALSAMWEAEKALRAITPKPALPPEYKALEAIKELQQADRIYLHKTAFNPPAIKEDKRMTGDVVGAAGYLRPQGEAADPVPAEVRALIQGLSGDGALPALWRRTAQDWVRERITADGQRLAAQRAIQDVADGCASCRGVLRAWLRGAIGEVPVQLQARPEAQTGFTKAWRAGERQ